MRPESAASGRRLSWISVTALALVPLLAVGVLLGLVDNAGSAQVNAAIVNLDEPVTVQDQYVPMGRQLAAAIVDESDENISWMLANEATALDGLRSGEFSVVVTIPESFSAAATSFGANDAAQAEQATIAVDVSENSPITDSQVGAQVARLATQTINSTLTETFIDNVFLGLNTVGDQFGQITDAVDQLSDGAGQLADGTTQAADGTTQLSDGLSLLGDAAPQLVTGGDQLADGSGQLVSGSSELASGARQFSSGVGEFTAGVDQLAAGAEQLDSGAKDLATGADGLATGIDQFATGVDGLAQGSKDLADGAAQLDAGMAELAGQAPQLVDGVGQLADGADQLLSQIPAFADGSKQVVLGVGELAKGLNQVAGGVSGDGITEPFQPLVDGAAGVAQGASGVSAGLDVVNSSLGGLASGNEAAQGAAGQIAAGVAGGFQCPIPDDSDTCALLAQTFAAGANAAAIEGFKAGAGAGVTALNTAQGGTTLLGAAAQVAGGAGQLSDGLNQVVDQLPGQFEELSGALGQLAAGADRIVAEAQPIVDNADALGAGSLQLLAGITELNGQVGALPDGINQLADGVSGLAGGASQLADGASQLSGGASELSAGASQLSGGIARFSGGVSQLSDGASQLSGGAGQLSGGADQLADGASQLGSGVAQFGDGVSQYADGVAQFADGVTQAADGAPELADGLSQLSDGAGELSEGLDTFASELAAGAEDLPSYSEADRARLSEVVTTPVVAPGGVAGSNTTALVSLLLVAGLWLGAMLSFVVVRAVPSNVVVSRASSLKLWARTVSLPALVVALQGAALGVVGGVVLGLGAGATLLLAAFLVGAAVSFVLANHALTAWLGNVGRGIAVLLLVATVTVAVSSVGAGWLTWLNGISPVQNAFLLVRAHAAGGSGLIGLWATALLLGVIALAASVLALTSRRSLTAAQFQRRLAA